MALAIMQYAIWNCQKNRHIKIRTFSSSPPWRQSVHTPWVTQWRKVAKVGSFDPDKLFVVMFMYYVIRESGHRYRDVFLLFSLIQSAWNWLEVCLKSWARVRAKYDHTSIWVIMQNKSVDTLMHFCCNFQLTSRVLSPHFIKRYTRLMTRINTFLAQCNVGPGGKELSFNKFIHGVQENSNRNLD